MKEKPSSIKKKRKFNSTLLLFKFQLPLCQILIVVRVSFPMQIDHHLILVDERKKEYFKNRLTFIWIAQ